MKKKNPIPNSKPFKKGQSGNPKGRPRLLVSTISAELKAQGLERVSPAHIAEAFELLFNLTIAELTLKVKDDNVPVLIRIVGKAILSGKGFEAIEKMLDRAHGKAMQKTESETKVILENFSLKDVLNFDNSKREV